MTCGDIDGFLSHHAGKAFGVLQQDSRVTMPPVFRECINKPDPRRKLRGLDIVKGRKGAEGHDFSRFFLNQHRHQGCPAHHGFQFPVPQKRV